MLRQAYVDGCPYKVAMIDFVMPDKNGMDLAREILADPAISSTKLILLTAFDAPGLASQTLNMGFSAYLTKPVRQSQMLESLINAISGTQSFGSATDEKSHEKREPIKPRKELILVAEDYVINQQVAQLYLDELGFASHIVSNGKQALEAASNKPYSLILMDCQMPEMDGFTAAQAIRRQGRKDGTTHPYNCRHSPRNARRPRTLSGSGDG
jgi:CheY-like chemotaxis protein